MENSLKAILMSAGVVVTLIVVSIGFMLMRSGQQAAKDTMGKLGQVNEELSESQYAMYDDNEVSGYDVVNALKKFKNEYIGIYVETKKNGGKWYIYSVSGDSLTASTNEMKNVMDEKSIEYINPYGKFTSEIQRDLNGTIIAIKFTQK
ncbi:MAG: hypothetical protein GX045_01300 [Clostridiaceae bacterium]|jgi:hypothetical protein|nr:hypothetical protein [Clostridiaceae bacterium]